MTAGKAVGSPPALAVKVDAISQELKSVRRWVSWEWSLRDGKWTKPPVDPKTGAPASTTEPNTWATLDETQAHTKKHCLSGLGIIPPDGMTVLDLDHCRDPDSEEIAPWARDIVDALPAYWEVSPLGTGFRGLV